VDKQCINGKPADGIKRGRFHDSAKVSEGSENENDKKMKAYTGKT